MYFHNSCSSHSKSFGLVKWNSKGQATSFNEKPVLNHFIGYAVISPNFLKKSVKKL